LFDLGVKDARDLTANRTILLQVSPASSPEKANWARLANTYLDAALYAETLKTLPDFYQDRIEELSRVNAAIGVIFARLAADPPRYDFQTIAEPLSFASTTLPALALTNVFDITLECLLEIERQIGGLARALLISVERELGAMELGDAFWRQEQAAAVTLYSAQLQDLLGRRSRTLAAISAAQSPPEIAAIVLTERDVVESSKQFGSVEGSSALGAWFTANAFSAEDVEFALARLQFAGSNTFVPAPLFSVLAEESAEATPLPTGLAVTTNAASYSIGQTMTVIGTLVPLNSPAAADAYVVLQLPNGQYLSLQLGGGLVPGIVPIARGIVPFNYAGVLTQHTFTGGEPPGRYIWLAALTQPGTLNLIGPLQQIPFTVP
jgi:hypothetical protein